MLKKWRLMFTNYPAFDIDLVTDNIVSGRLSLDTAQLIDEIIGRSELTNYPWLVLKMMSLVMILI